MALACVCFFWGTTYLGIRVAVESIPPAVLVCFRFLLSGGLMLAGAAAAKARFPRRRELWITALYGVVILGIGNGCLVYAEVWVPSGLAALFVTTSPFWFVGVESMLPGGEPLRGRTLRGMLVGLGGVVLLVGPAAIEARSGTTAGLAGGFFLLQFGTAGWVLGSLLQRRRFRHPATPPVHPFVSGAIQQVATGLAYIIPAAAGPSVHWTARGAGAMLYLVVFGSIVGYSAYLLAINRLPVAIGSLYTYVNPVVAVILGWLFLREPFGVRDALAMAIIFAGVALVNRASVPAQKLGSDGAAQCRQDGKGYERGAQQAGEP